MLQNSFFRILLIIEGNNNYAALSFMNKMLKLLN